MKTDELVSGIISGLSTGGLTLETVVRVIVLLLVGMLVIKLLMKVVDRAMDRAKNLAPIRVYIRSMVHALLWFLLILMLADALSIPVTSIIALLSVAGLAVSLALQNTLSNLAGGIVVLVSKPFVPGDYVEADGMSGTVAECGLAYTKLMTIDNKEIFIPNSQIAAAKIINYSAAGRRRVDLNFTASYDAPTQAVKDAIQEVLDGIPEISPDPAPEIHLTAYQSSSIQYVVRAWTTAADYWTVYFALQEGVRESFARHGVEMTYDHLNVHLVEK